MRTSGSGVRFEGYSADELIAAPGTLWDQWVLTGHPLVCRVGTAQVLGRFRVSGDVLVVELAHVDGGGEGILVAIWSLAFRLASEWGLAEVEWLVHAVWCANPNGRLQELMVRRGFVVVEHLEVGPVYQLRRSVTGRRAPCLPEGVWRR